MFALGTVAGCSFEPAMPANAIVAARVPGSWVPLPSEPDARPRIVGARFSSLDVALGKDWSGDVITSTEVRRVSLFTNLYEIEAKRVGPGRFTFVQHMVDAPAFIVRPYTLDVVARDADGATATLAVPFRIRGRGVS